MHIMEDNKTAYSNSELADANEAVSEKFLQVILPQYNQTDKKKSSSFSRRKIHSSPAKTPSLQQRRRFSQDSGVLLKSGQMNNYNANGHPAINNSDPYIRRSSDNLRLTLRPNNIGSAISNTSNGGGGCSGTATDKHQLESKLSEEEDFMDSPLLLQPPVMISMIEPPWLEVHNNRLNEVLSDKSNDPFGPKVIEANGTVHGLGENIPGTPMEPAEIKAQKNYELNHAVVVSELLERTSLHTAKQITHNLGNDEPTPPPPLPSTQQPESYSRRTSDEQSTSGGTSTNRSSFKTDWLPGIKRKSNASVVSDEIDRRPSKQDKEGLDPESLMFRDGRRKIDMVLCFEEENEGVMTELEARRREQRRIFQENLIKEGLEVEMEDKTQAFDEKTCFIKIHMPWRIESRYAEVMNMKLPIKRFITISVKAWDDDKDNTKEKHFWKKWIKWFHNVIELEANIMDDEQSFYVSTAGGNAQEQFIVKDRCTSYTSAQRSLMVMQILLRAKFDETEKSGIRRLLNDGSYLACFPLHEGRYDKVHSSGAVFDRRLLYLHWARPDRWYKVQPLCLVRKYFGDKIALYFCWLGFYTEMLVYPAIVGTLCFVYGLASMSSHDNTPSREICDTLGVGNITLCPLCDKACSYQQLSDSCLFSQITYLFDNPSTVFFAIFMSFWATTFLELWKRKQSVIVWEWDLQNAESDEENRPEFEASVKTFRTNPVTREKEPYMPTWSRALRYFITGSAVFFMICVVLGAVLGTIIYRLSVVSVIYGGGGFFVKTHAKIFTSMTAALINLIIIMILTRIYHKLAIHLTNMENPRTQTEYEDSYTFKIFFFEFMNFYSSLIYIAFFKGRFFDYPGDDVVRKSDFFRLKGDICDPAGCLSELCIQLAIIMVGKQTWNNFMEYLFPKFWNWWRQRKHKQQTKDETHLHMSWEQDYHLQDPGRLALFDEYLEMILQYGFVTLFVAAFPLAPLFALINNVAEIRLDAYKMITQARRPLAERVEDIGAWYGILRIITYIAVVSNAFVIAYTSDFIPRMVYKYVYSPDETLRGYISHSLATFNTSDYKQEWGAVTEHDPDTCQYRGYRNDPTALDPYGLSPHYWHVFAARLSFVVIFEHIVFILTGIMRFIIPDIPAEVRTQMQREQLLAKEAKYQTGLKKNRENEYEDLLHALREHGGGPGTAGGGAGSVGSSKIGLRGSWARRFSKMSDGLDAHVEVVTRHRRSVESTVWEVT